MAKGDKFRKQTYQDKHKVGSKISSYSGKGLSERISTALTSSRNNYNKSSGSSSWSQKPATIVSHRDVPVAISIEARIGDSSSNMHSSDTDLASIAMFDEDLDAETSTANRDITTEEGFVAEEVEPEANQIIDVVLPDPIPPVPANPIGQIIARRVPAVQALRVETEVAPIRSRRDYITLIHGALVNRNVADLEALFRSLIGVLKTTTPPRQGSSRSVGHGPMMFQRTYLSSAHNGASEIRGATDNEFAIKLVEAYFDEVDLKPELQKEFIKWVKESNHQIFQVLFNPYRRRGMHKYFNQFVIKGNLDIMIRFIPIEHLSNFVNELTPFSLHQYAEPLKLVLISLGKRARKHPDQRDIIEPLFAKLKEDALHYHGNKPGFYHKCHTKVVSELIRMDLDSVAVAALIMGL